jgi:hypothetical protein
MRASLRSRQHHWMNKHVLRWGQLTWLLQTVTRLNGELSEGVDRLTSGWVGMHIIWGMYQSVTPLYHSCKRTGPPHQPLRVIERLNEKRWY